MGGTVYDRDTIMKKYMNGYDGNVLMPCTMTAVCVMCQIHQCSLRQYQKMQPGDT